MKNSELNVFLTNDYIYIPYDGKDKLNLRSDNLVFKNDQVSEYLCNLQYSPVSGKAYGLSAINSLDGLKNVLIVENDFMDKVSKKLISVKNLYDIDKSEVINKTRNLVGDSKVLTLEVSITSNNDLTNQYLLRDNVKEILETLNIIDDVYQDLSVRIKLDKQDVPSYQLLFTYIGTYPNIDIVFVREDTNDKVIDIYQVIDVYDAIKNRSRRDYIYVTVLSKDTLDVIKTKRNSNLKDLMEYLNLMSTNILINNKFKISNGNFLLDEKVKTVNIM